MSKPLKNPHQRPISSWLIKYDDKTVAEWRRRVLAGETQTDIALDVGVYRTVLGRAIRRSEKFRREYCAFLAGRKRAGQRMWHAKRRTAS